MGPDFFELPVYRLTEREYDAWFKERQEKYVRDALGGVVYERAEMYLRESFGEKYGPWRYNEIVGYIRLYFFGSQVRGAYYSAMKDKRVLKRKKVFTCRELKLAPDMDFPQPLASSSILDTIQAYIEECRKILPDKLVVDDALFQQLAPHTDWLSLYLSLRR